MENLERGNDNLLLTSIIVGIIGIIVGIISTAVTIYSIKLTLEDKQQKSDRIRPE